MRIIKYCLSFILCLTVLTSLHNVNIAQAIICSNGSSAGQCPSSCGGGLCPSNYCGYATIPVGACGGWQPTATPTGQSSCQYSYECSSFPSCDFIYTGVHTKCTSSTSCDTKCCEERGGLVCIRNGIFPSVTIPQSTCWEECATVWCCDTSPPPTTTPPAGCDCSAWTNGACGGGGCPSNQRYQSRTCTPTGCSTETRCAADAACDPTIDPFPVTVRLRVENNSYLSGGVCQQASSTAQNVASGSILVSNNGGFSQTQPLSDSSSASFSIPTAGYYNVMVSIPVSDALQFTCPATVSESGGNYTAFYSDVYLSPTANTTLDLFLRDQNLAADWFQVMGGLTYANNRLRSPVPSVTCGPHASCIDALLTLLTSTEFSSAGVPFLFASNALNLQTSDQQSTYHNYISPSNKTPNRNSYVTSFRLPSSNYQALRSLVGEQLRAVSSADNPPIWRTQTWWQSGGDNFVEVTGDLTITEASGYQIAAGESLTVFVNGNLTFNDSNTGDTNRKITSVAKGGFLAFIVSGDILVRNRVGWALAVPSSPSNMPAIPALTQTNANLEGVFIADGTLTLQSNAAVSAAMPDRKFIGNGTFVGWGGVLLNRSFDNGGNGAMLSSVQAVENFIYRPDLLARWPEMLKLSTSSWREVSPTLVGQ